MVIKSYNEANCDGGMETKLESNVFITGERGLIERMKDDNKTNSQIPENCYNLICQSKIKSEETISSISYGTGFIIKDSIVVTNSHVVNGKSKITLVLNDGSQVMAGILAEDTHNDIALLKSDLLQNYKGLYISKTPIRSGSKVFTVGFPHPDVMGIEPKTADGIVNSLTGVANDPRLMQISIPVQSGNSGGPVMNMNGEVVGIVVSKLNAAKMLSKTGDVTQNVNYAIKLPYLTALLDTVTNNNQSQKKILTKGTKLEDISAVVSKSVVLIRAE